MIPCTSMKNSKDAKTVAWSSISIDEQNSIWSELSTLLFLLKTTSIVITEDYASKVFERVYRFAGTLTFVITFLFVASEVAFCGFTRFVTTSVVLCMFFTLSMSVMLWVTTFCKRKAYSRIISRLGETRLHYNTAPVCNGVHLRNKIALCYIIFIPVLASILSIISVDPDDLYFYLYCYLFGYPKEDNSFNDKFLLFFFLTIENYTQFFVPNLVTWLIFLLCEYTSNSIEGYVKFCKSPRVYIPQRNANELKMLEFYKNIKDNFKLLESAISTSVFIILSQKFVTLFFTLTVILSQNKILTQLIESLCFSVNGILSISILIISGSRIKEAHRKIRALFLELGNLLDKQQALGLKEFQLLPVMKIFVEQEDMTLSAAKMIPLTRSLFLKIGAALVTYGVLIVQFESRS